MIVIAFGEFNNENFNLIEFDQIKNNEVGLTRFIMILNCWKKEFTAIGIISNAVIYKSFKINMLIIHIILNL